MAIYTSSTWRKLHLIVTSVAGPGGAFGASETAQFAFTLINAKLMNTGPDPGTVVVVAGLAIDDVGVCGVVEAVTADGELMEGLAEDVVDEPADLVGVVAPSGADVEVSALFNGTVVVVDGAVEVVAALVADEVQPTTATRHVATIEIF